MKNNYLFLLLIFIIFTFLAYFSGGQVLNLLQDDNYIDKELISNENAPVRSFEKLKVGDKELEVELVRDEQSQKKGLSGRDQIGSDGMLFIFDKEKLIPFWMKEMNFDIDIIWIKSGQVIQITKNVPKPDESEGPLPLYFPQEPIDQVLEVVAGDSQKFGIEVGDSVNIIF